MTQSEKLQITKITPREDKASLSHMPIIDLLITAPQYHARSTCDGLFNLIDHSMPLERCSQIIPA